MPNIFLQRKAKLRLSYRSIAISLNVQHGYVYRIMQNPGATSNYAIIVRLGMALGMTRDEIANEWIHLRISHLVAQANKQAGV